MNKITILILVFLFNSNLSFSQSSEIKKNFIYLTPSSLLGDLWINQHNLWFELGYSRIVKNKHKMGLRSGFIFKSYDATGVPAYILNVKSTKGFNFSLDYQNLFNKNLYFGGEINFQKTTSIREEIDHSNIDYTLNLFDVKRIVYGLIPKIGFQSLKNNLFFDFGIGYGLRYISSKSFGKVDINQNLEREFYSKKIFDDGAKFAPRFIIQVKIGYNF